MAEYLACFETELSSEVFELFVLYSQENYVLKGNLCIRCMWTFHSRFIPFGPWFLTAWTDSPASWCYASCFEVLINGLLNIIVREIISLSVVCSFVVNKIAQNTILRLRLQHPSWITYMWCFSHYIHDFCEDVGTFYRTFTFRFSFWAHFDTQLMNIILKVCLISD